MAIEIKHAHQVDLVANPPDGVSVVQFDDWNEAHEITLASGRLVGRASSGIGAAEELSPAQARALLNVADGATANDTDANLRNRANHTGSQAQSTITNLTTDLAAKAPINNPTFTGSVTLPGDPSSNLQAATKQYVDGMMAGVAKRARVRVATTGNITISSALNNGDVLDGVTLATGDLVLVKNQTTASQNGVYVVGATPVRAAEFDSWGEFPGSLIGVYEGTVNGDTLWLNTNNDGGTLGSTAIVFTQLRVAGELLAANNLSDVASPATAFDSIKQAATTSAAGVVELATDALAIAGVDTTRATTSANIAAVFADRVGVTAGKLVALDGSAKLPAVDGSQLVNLPSGGAMIPIGAAVTFMSPVAAVDVSINTTPAFDAYVLEFWNLIPSTGGQRLYARCAAGGAFETGSVYEYGVGGSLSDNVELDQPRIQITGNSPLGARTSYPGASGKITIFSPTSSLFKRIIFDVGFDDGTNTVRSTGAAIYKKTSPMTAIRLVLASGNLASGSYQLYGVTRG